MKESMAKSMIGDLSEQQKFAQLKAWFGKTSPMPPNLSELIQTEKDEFPLVKPESMINTNQMASASLGIAMELGPDDVRVLQHKQEFSPVFPDAVTL